ncbi:porin [Cystobacter fuscus]|uniref:Porin n=1 Tax=Cystobacter fuscus TaxID=43 RepID=A0A250J6B4_9BACT|nr:porin [Cystobacter fuscus]ATB39017.1 porin [Cystobacter fuscus]
MRTLKRGWMVASLMTWSFAAPVRADEAPPPANAPTATSQITLPSTGGLNVTSSNGQFEVTLRGRIQVDGGAFRNDALGTKNVSGTELRRVRLGAAGQALGWRYLVEVDFAGDGVEAQDLWISRTLGPGQLTVGQFKPAFSIEDQTNDLYVVMQERSFLASTLAPGFQIGVGYAGDVGVFTYGVALYNLDRNNASHDRGFGGSGRVTFAPWRTEGRVLHVGVAVAREHTDLMGDGKQPGVSLRVRTAGHLADGSRFLLLGFNDNSSVDSTKGVLELAGVYGPLSLQAEAAQGRYASRSARGRLSTWYVQASGFLTGESRAYDATRGRFQRLVPRGRFGALELAVRYDVARGLTTPAVEVSNGIEVHAATAGINWYVNERVRLTVNGILATVEDPLNVTALDDTRAVTARLQLEF